MASTVLMCPVPRSSLLRGSERQGYRSHQLYLFDDPLEVAFRRSGRHSAAQARIQLVRIPIETIDSSGDDCWPSGASHALWPTSSSSAR